MKLKRIWLGGLLAIATLIAASLLAVPAFSAPPPCSTGTLTGTVYGDVTVAPGASCTIRGNVYGNVNVGAGATLKLVQPGHVYGSVNAATAAAVTIGDGGYISDDLTAGGDVTFIRSWVYGDADCATATSITRDSRTHIYGTDGCAV